MVGWILTLHLCDLLLSPYLSPTRARKGSLILRTYVLTEPSAITQDNCPISRSMTSITPTKSLWPLRHRLTGSRPEGLDIFAGEWGIILPAKDGLEEKNTLNKRQKCEQCNLRKSKKKVNSYWILITFKEESWGEGEGKEKLNKASLPLRNHILVE